MHLFSYFFYFSKYIWLNKIFKWRKKMDGCARFDDRIPIEYTPKEFYDELIAVQSKFQSKKILNYIEDQIITELGKDNLDLINNFGEIKKFRQILEIQINKFKCFLMEKTIFIISKIYYYIFNIYNIIFTNNIY